MKNDTANETSPSRLKEIATYAAVFLTTMVLTATMTMAWRNEGGMTPPLSATIGAVGFATIAGAACSISICCASQAIQRKQAAIRKSAQE